MTKGLQASHVCEPTCLFGLERVGVIMTRVLMVMVRVMMIDEIV